MILKKIILKSILLCTVLRRAALYYHLKLRLKNIGKNVIFFKGVVIHNPENVTIGDSTALGDYVIIWGGSEVIIGSNVLIATHTVIAGSTHDPEVKPYNSKNISHPIVIGENVWIGANCVIMPGVCIGDNAIIGAGSIVKNNVPEGVIVAGNPAEFIKKV